MSRRGELNLGQLARQRWPTTSPWSASPPTRARSRRLVLGRTGRAQAGAAGAAGELRGHLPPGRRASFVLDLVNGDAAQALAEPRLERAIGVIYRPETERQSHYFFAHLAGQFDAVVHIDETRAVEPLERSGGWEVGEPPETYPSAL